MLSVASMARWSSARPLRPESSAPDVPLFCRSITLHVLGAHEDIRGGSPLQIYILLAVFFQKTGAACIARDHTNHRYHMRDRNPTWSLEHISKTNYTIFDSVCRYYVNQGGPFGLAL